MVRVSSEVRAAIISAVVSLITTWLVIQAMIPAPVPHLYVSPNPSDSWVPVDTRACAVVKPSTVFRFEITLVGIDHVTILRMILNATNWSKPHTMDYHLELSAGDSTTLTFWWSPDLVNPGHVSSFTVSIVTVELPLQTLQFCISYS